MVDNTKQGATRNWEKRNEAVDTAKKGGFFENFEIQSETILGVTPTPSFIEQPNI
jgi:hypothetical protein